MFFTGELGCLLAMVKNWSAWLETALAVLLLVVTAWATLALLEEELPAVEEVVRADDTESKLAKDDAEAEAEELLANGSGSVVTAPM